MEVPATIGCALYSISGLGFTLLLILAMGLSWHANRERRRRLAGATVGERLGTPPSLDDERRTNRIYKVFMIAFAFFAIALFVEFFGLELGLFADQTACPDGWQQPRSLRALSS